MSLDTRPDELAEVLRSERDWVASATIESRARLQARLDALEATFGRGPAGISDGNGHGHSQIQARHVDLRDPVLEARIVDMREPALHPQSARPVDSPKPTPRPKLEPAPDWLPNARSTPPVDLVYPEPTPAAAPPPAEPLATPSPPPIAPVPLGSARSTAKALATSRKLLLVGGLLLGFVANERYITPWVAHNGQGQLRGERAPILSIPSIDLDVAVAGSTRTSSLRKGLGRDPKSAKVGNHGNIVIAGHRSTYGEPFGKLGRLKKGASIQLTGTKGTIDYKVDSVRGSVPSSDRTVRAQHGDDRLTLVTAASGGRLVVVAKAVDGAQLKGNQRAKTTSAGTLWPTPTFLALAAVLLCVALGLGFTRALSYARSRYGETNTLLVAVPLGGVLIYGFFQAIERVLGTLY